MENSDASTHESSHTQRIIQKSSLLSFPVTELACIWTYCCSRIILASIKNLGKHPCPRCHVQMEDVPKMGEHEDCLTRAKTARADNQSRQNAVTEARALIYKDNLAVTNPKVEELL